MMNNAVTLYARARPGFTERASSALALLQQAAHRHPGRIVLSTSLGVEDMVLTDLIARHQVPIALATLDTGLLHPETLALVLRLEARYGLSVERWIPYKSQVIEFVSHHGDLAMRQSVDLRKACCGMRKLEPLARLLAGRTAWVTGLRRDQSGARADVPLTSRDDLGREKISPLAEWSLADVWHYVQLHAVPYNPLHDQFYPSIGCAPCTRAVAMGEDIRAGRWWWENESAKECGLHSSPHATGAAAPAGLRSAAIGAIASAQAHIGAADVKGAPASGRSPIEGDQKMGLPASQPREVPA